jgi:acyl-CoA thioesterase
LDRPGEAWLNSPANPVDIAARVRETLFREDWASKAMGMEFVAFGRGHATIRMAVRRDMLNGFGMCHGGIISTLADTAMAFASNSHNVMSVATSLAIDFVAPARLDDSLTAEARESATTSRTGVYDVRVTNQRGELVALVRGRVHRFKDRSVFSE